LKSLIAFVSGMVVARALGPQEYGTYGYLVGVFSAICGLTDLGASNVFFTLISKRPRVIGFYVRYCGWIFFQFILVAALVMILPAQQFLLPIFSTDDRLLVGSACLCVYLNIQVVGTLINILEAHRLSAASGVFGVIAASVYAASLVFVESYFGLGAVAVFMLGGAQALILTVCMIFLVWRKDIFSESDEDAGLHESFVSGTRPLVIMSLMVFAYNFIERWFLQQFGGVMEQAYFHLSNQMSAAVLIVTTSILKIMWKEVSNALELGDHEKVEFVYKSTLAGVLLAGSIMAGILVPFSKEILVLTAGEDYIGAWIVLAVMLVYPLLQSIGQLGGTMLIAKGRTDLHSKLSVIAICVSIPLTYLMLAPESNYGMNLGGLGLATKMVLLSLVTTTVQSTIIAREFGWKFEPAQYISSPVFFLISGFAAKVTAGHLLDMLTIEANRGVYVAVCTAILYGAVVLVSPKFLPSAEMMFRLIVKRRDEVSRA
jgi:O-antigen/teichoic acid export membrane protein